MINRLSRRDFLGQTTTGLILSAAYAGLPARAAAGPSEKLNIACVGCQGRAWDSVEAVAQAKHNIVALADIDSKNLDKALAQLAKMGQTPKVYRDYRQMFDKEAGAIDAVTVATADHSHAPASAVALRLGKHVYCEKPLTHTVTEARALATLATKNKLVTQMGTQIHAGDNYRRAVELVQSGAIGNVTAVHAWCNKGWSDGRFVKTDQPCPAHLDWDLFLGPAPERPYSPGIHPANWRKFWDYGSGTLGDMGCHIIDLVFWAMKFRHPTSVEAEGPPVHADGAPAWLKVKWAFPARGDMPAATLTWSDGGKHWDEVAKVVMPNGKPLSSWGIGALFIGDKGSLACDYGQRVLMPVDQFKDFKAPAASLPKSIGHHQEWFAACKANNPAQALCGFDYSGALTETVLLGCAAYRAGQKIEWNGEACKAQNAAAGQYIDKPYRKGWDLVRQALA